jgi:hypothetical protein
VTSVAALRKTEDPSTGHRSLDPLGLAGLAAPTSCRRRHLEVEVEVEVKFES